jgi:multidrug efflux pump subunit AcrA (membrane-fusion protein)
MIRLLRSRWLWVPLLFVAFAASGGLFYKARKYLEVWDPLKARSHHNPVPIRTTLVADAQVEEVIGATCLTYPSQQAGIQLGPSKGLSALAPISEIAIKAIHVHEGDYVKKGQVLWEMEDRFIVESAAQTKQAMIAALANLKRVQEQVKYNQTLRQYNLTSAKANLKYRQDDMNDRRQEYDIYKKLYGEKNGGVSLFQVLDSFSLYAATIYQVAAAEYTLEEAKVSVIVGPLKDTEELENAKNLYEIAKVNNDLLQHDVERIKIKAPVDGYIDLTAKIEPVPGQIILLNQVFMQVLQLNPIHFRLDYPQERIDDVFVGQEAECLLDSFPKERFHGKVIRISPQVNAQLRVLPVVVEVENPNIGTAEKPIHRIKAGISGYVRLKAKRKARAVAAQAVIQQGDKAMVFCVENGKTVIKPVVTGHILETGLLEIKSGLKAGEEVVIYNDFYQNVGSLGEKNYLQEGEQVNPDWRQWARRE